jgi:hypothetical protein
MWDNSAPTPKDLLVFLVSMMRSGDPRIWNGNRFNLQTLKPTLLLLEKKRTSIQRFRLISLWIALPRAQYIMFVGGI